MSQFINVRKKKANLFVFAVCFSLILCWILYPSLRYEKSSIGMTEIKYDKFTGVIYLKDLLNPDTEWIPTDYKNIMETKYHLAQKELEKAIKETKNETRQKPRQRESFDKIIVIPASP